jgi:hypothetical protein
MAEKSDTRWSMGWHTFRPMLLRSVKPEIPDERIAVLAGATMFALLGRCRGKQVTENADLGAVMTDLIEGSCHE